VNVLLFPSVARAAILSRLNGFASLKVHSIDREEDLQEVISDVEVMILPGHCYTQRVARLVKSHGRMLRFIQLLSSGYEELQALGVPEGVVIANAGNSWAPSVAEHAMSLMLALARQVPDMLESQRRRYWNREIASRMRSLDGATLAIVGYGNIGREVAIRAHAFGMRVIAVRRSAAANADTLADRVEPVSSLLSVLGEADVVLVAVPSSNKTDGLIGGAELAACKPGALIVNIARGKVIDTTALLAALKSGHIAGAALDVTDPEPLPEDHPLWGMPHVIISPHVSIGGSGRGIERLANAVAENLHCISLGLPVVQQVTI
jgi:phosphoglycerate dehydrogenase-like enzyme